MYYVIAYFITVIFVNLGFSLFPPVDLLFLGPVPPVVFAVGVIFVLRDYAQKALGHYVIIPVMIAATGVSYWLADPIVAIASAAAFFVGETIDWLVYTITKKPFHQRVLLSSAIAIPVDSYIFLTMVDFYAPGVMFAMVASKLLASILVWCFYMQEKLWRDLMNKVSD